MFSNFFGKQCTIVNSTSQLPTNSPKRTNNCRSTIPFAKDNIAKIIKNLHPIKANGHDMINIRMLRKPDKQLKENYRPISLLPIWQDIRTTNL